MYCGQSGYFLNKPSIPRFQFNKVTQYRQSIQNQSGYHFYARGHMGSFEMWCCRGMKMMIRIDRVKNEVLPTIKGHRNILHTIQWRKANWIGHIMCRNCLLKDAVERKIKMTGKWCKVIMNELKGKWGCYKLKEEALNSTVWKLVWKEAVDLSIRQTTNKMNSTTTLTNSVGTGTSV